ncbi:CHAT domain-containing protein [Niabella aquatica]
MKNLLLIFLAVSGYITAIGQYTAGDYVKAKMALRQNRLDSSIYYINNARQYFTSRQNFDSLALTLALEAQVIWEKETLASAMAKACSSIQIVLGRLPAKSAGRVALNAVTGCLYASKYKFDSAAIYYKKALHAADTMRPHLPLVILYMNLCQMEMLKEHIEKADYYYNKAYNTLQSVDPADEITLADLLISRTQYFIVGGMYNQALETALQVEPLLKKHYRPDNPKLAKNYGNLSAICYYLSRYEEALVYRQQALNVYLRNGVQDISNNGSFYVTYYNMGQLYYYLNEYSLATNYLSKALHIGANIYGRQSLGMVNILVQFGSAQQKLKRYGEAKNYFEEAYHIQKELNPNDYWTLGYIESFYGDMFADGKEYDSAIYYYNTSVANYSRINEAQSYYSLYTRASLACVYAETGNTAMALHIQKDVLQKFRKSFPFLKQPVIEFFNDIAQSYLKANKLDSAMLYADSSVLFQTGLKSLPDDPAGWLPKLPFSFKVSELVRVRLSILYEMYEQSKQKKYLHKLLNIIAAYSDHISANIYKLRTQQSLAEQSEMNKAIFSIGIDACWELGNDDKNGQQYLEKAFMLSEQGKALLLRLAFNSFMIDDAMMNDDAIVMRDIELRKQISSLNEQHLNAEAGSDSLLRLLTTSIEIYRSFQDSLKKTGNPYFNKRYAVAAFSLKEIRKELLEDDATLIEYALTERYLYSFVVTKNSFYAKRANIGSISTVKALQNPQALSATAFRDSAYKLYTDLIKPVEAYFTSGRLIIVPDADLYYLNFEALVTETGNHDFTSLRYLIHQYTISYLLSANVAVQLKQFDRKDKTTDKALLFAPVFTDAMKRLYQKRANAIQGDSAYLYLFRQPFALQAARNIYSLMSADMFIEQQAQESIFRQNSSRYKILHLGTHAHVNDIDPLQSQLFFAKPLQATTPDNDGNLYAYEIYSMQLRAELAVLTACETGTGAVHSGEGVMSLAYSFMFAGCPSVVMSLWKIDEKTNADIITRFYKYLKKGNTKSEALRKAKLDFLKSNSVELANPFYWAGLCIIGDDHPVYSNNSIYYWLAGAVAIIILLAVLLKTFVARRKIRKYS